MTSTFLGLHTCRTARYSKQGVKVKKVKGRETNGQSYKLQKIHATSQCGAGRAGLRQRILLDPHCDMIEEIECADTFTGR